MAPNPFAALIRVVARGKGGETSVWSVWTFRGETPTGMTYFGDDRAAAFEAARIGPMEATNI